MEEGGAGVRGAISMMDGKRKREQAMPTMTSFRPNPTASAPSLAAHRDSYHLTQRGEKGFE